MRRPAWLTLALALGFASGLAAAPTPDQSPRRNDPIVLFLRGRIPRPPPEYPRAERLATYERYDAFDTSGRRVAFLLQMEYSPLPAFRFANEKAFSAASLTLDRRTRAFWHVRNRDLISIGRLRRTKVVRGEYDWTDVEDNSIAALVPVGGTDFYHLRGGDELREFLTERLKIQLPGSAAARVRALFQKLHAAERAAPPGAPTAPR